jgi:serine/threonine-protein kinase
VDRFAHDAAIQIAMIHAWRGERDRAFEWLGKAVDQRDGGVGLARWVPELRALRDDPRYPALLRRIDLLPE